MSKLHRNRIFGEDSNHIDVGELPAIKAYREERDKRKEWLQENMTGAPYNHNCKYEYHGRFKKPWWYLTSGKCFNSEERKTQFGTCTKTWKVQSEASELYAKTIRHKMTREDYIEACIKHKLDKWKKTHPEPQKDDLFYKQEHPKWVADYETIHDKIVGEVSKRYIEHYTKRTINHILDSKHKYSIAA